jgi:hypothetical protein
MKTMTNPVMTTRIPSSVLAFGGDVGAEVAALAIDSGKETQIVEQQAEQADEDRAARAEADQVNQMRQKADDMRTQGIVDGSTTMGEGALSAAAAGCSFRASGASPTSGMRAGELNAEGGWYKSAATGLDGSTKLADGFFGAAGANADANAKASEASAERAHQAARDAHDAAAGAQSAIDKTLSFYEQYTQVQASTALAILHRA